MLLAGGMDQQGIHRAQNHDPGDIHGPSLRGIALTGLTAGNRSRDPAQLRCIGFQKLRDDIHGLGCLNMGQAVGQHLSPVVQRHIQGRDQLVQEIELRP